MFVAVVQGTGIFFWVGPMYAAIVAWAPLNEPVGGKPFWVGWGGLVTRYLSSLTWGVMQEAKLPRGLSPSMQKFVSMLVWLPAALKVKLTHPWPGQVVE